MEPTHYYLPNIYNGSLNSIYYIIFTMEHKHYLPNIYNGSLNSISYITFTMEPTHYYLPKLYFLHNIYNGTYTLLLT